jgi:S-adenosyl-L-methionine hydrolase (adenosine-forming)
LPVASQTFHGRDIFAPAAAHLAEGVPLQALGPVLSEPVQLPLPLLDTDNGGKNHRGEIRGEVMYIDHFGNVITSIGRLVWDGGLLRLDPAFGPAVSLTINPNRVRVVVGGRDLGPIRRTYGEVAVGASLVLVGSAGLLEIAVNQGNGARDLGLEVGDPVLVTGSRPLD